MNETTTNKGMIYIVVATVAFLAAFCVVTLCVLSYKGIQVPPELNTLTGGLVGYLAAMLTKTTPTETIKQPPPNGNPTPVQVVNEPANPVPVKDGEIMADRDTKDPQPTPPPPPQ